MDRTYIDKDLSGQDFTDIDMSGKTVAHSVLTGCKFKQCVGTRFICVHGENIDFSEADISGASFEKADASVLRCLVGATWNGIKITAVSGWLTDDLYWAFCTNAFVQCGCMVRTLAEWQRICQTEETTAELLIDEPRLRVRDAYIWWQIHHQQIEDTVAALTA